MSDHTLFYNHLTFRPLPAIALDGSEIGIILATHRYTTPCLATDSWALGTASATLSIECEDIIHASQLHDAISNDEGSAAVLSRLVKGKRCILSQENDAGPTAASFDWRDHRVQHATSEAGTQATIQFERRSAPGRVIYVADLMRENVTLDDRTVHVDFSCDAYSWTDPSFRPQQVDEGDGEHILSSFVRERKRC